MTRLMQWEANRHCGHLPLRERVVDELAAMLFAADTILESLDTEEANRFFWIEPHVRRLYDQVNALMHQMTQS